MTTTSGGQRQLVQAAAALTYHALAALAPDPLETAAALVQPPKRGQGDALRQRMSESRELAKVVGKWSSCRTFASASNVAAERPAGVGADWINLLQQEISRRLQPTPSGAAEGEASAATSEGDTIMQDEADEGGGAMDVAVSGEESEDSEGEGEGEEWDDDDSDGADEGNAHEDSDLGSALGTDDEDESDIASDGEGT